MIKEQKIKLIPFSKMKRGFMKRRGFRKAYESSQFEFGIVKKILDYRIKKNLNQQECAYKLGISKYLLNKFMLDPDNSRLSAIQKITQGLGLKLTVK